MFDFNAIMNIKNHWANFCYNHPKVSPFIQDVKSHGSCVGQEIAIAIRYPDGTEYKCGIRVQESDLQLLDDIRSISRTL